MPNWCDCQYTCVGSEKDIQKLYNTIDKLYKSPEPLVKNTFGKSWLGCLIFALGGDYNKVYCRGQIIDYWIDNRDGTLIFNMETAWTEIEQTRHFVETVFPGMKIYYIEEEPGCGVYTTNDKTGKYYPDRYFLDCEEDPNYFRTIEDAANRVSEMIGQIIKPTKESIQKAINDYIEKKQENGEEVWCSFHEFLIVED